MFACFKKPPRVRVAASALCITTLLLQLFVPQAYAADPPRTLAVTTNADRVDGNTSSFSSLLASPGNDKRISLREAILAANNTALNGVLTISFDLPASQETANGEFIILITPALRGLPAFSRGSVVLDATLSNGRRVVIDGGNNNLVTEGLIITSPHNSVLGLTIRNSYNSGLVLRSKAANNLLANMRIERNHYNGMKLEGSGVVGNRVVGSALVENAVAGVEVFAGARNNQIGGDMLDANEFRANGFFGIYIHDPDTDNNNVVGNTFRDHQPSGTSYVYPVWLANRAKNTLIERNLIVNNQYGIRIDSSSENTIVGNMIGVGADGAQAQPNNEHGLMLLNGANQNLVGGETPQARNVISGNGKHGVYVYASSGNSIRGNYIGTSGDGQTALGNGQSGVFLQQASGNTVDANIVAANRGEGIKTDSANSVIANNRIGVGENNVPLPNERNGIWSSGRDTVIGPGNTIRHHTLSGILVTAQRTEVLSNTLEQNYRGVCISAAGVSLRYNTVRSNGTGTGGGGDCSAKPGGILASGGQALITENTIHNNTGAGVVVLSGEGNSVQANSITNNSLAGIALNQGANEQLAPPVVHAVTAEAISGTGCAACTIELFTDSDDEGKTLLGTVTADADGNFSLPITPAMLTGPIVTATTTDAEGNTSAFASPLRVPRSVFLRPTVYLPVVSY